MLTRGFRGKHRGGEGAGADRVPPGQYVTDDFPVLSAGPTPRTALEAWSFALLSTDGRELLRLGWRELLALPATEVTVDIHCVTKWSKLGTRWKGVTFDALLASAGLEPPAPFVMAMSDGGYATNLPVADLRGGKGMIAYEYDGAPLVPEHGGPARLLVPHLYFWKSAKWLRALRFMATDQPGFWEAHGYHIYGDPWKEQRYDGD
jgi:DMSO/TMAO reductase YedYZ molybdopterin-dependent catalytic subunit